MTVARRSILVVASLAVILAATLLWLRSRDEPAGPAELRVGVILPLTGDSAYLGTSIQEGIEIARAELDSLPEAERPFSLTVRYIDSGGDVARVVTAYQDLASRGAVPAVIAVQQGVKALIPLVARDERVLLCTSVPDNGITGQNPWTFRFFINAESDASTIASYAREKLGVGRAAIAYVNDSMGLSYEESFRRHFSAAGGEIVASETYAPDAADFRALALRIRQANPEAIYLVGYGRSMASLPIQLREAGVTATFLAVGTISQPEIMEAAGEAANGTYYTTAEFFTFAPETPELQAFVDRFQARFGEVPVFFEVFGYDSLRLLIDAARRGGTEAAGLRDALAATRALPLAAGRVTVAADGDVRFPVVVKRIVDGRWEPAP